MSLVFDPTGVGFYDTGTGALGLPSGTTAQRPSSPVNGYMRYNTTTNSIESYVNGSWNVTSAGTYAINLLVVGGGGSGGGRGGGGAGGVVYTTGSLLVSGTAYTVTVGAGGAGTSGGNYGTTGSSSSLGSTLAYGGGGGEVVQSGIGSGGGNTWSSAGNYSATIPGTLGQGNAGGAGHARHRQI